MDWLQYPEQLRRPLLMGILNLTPDSFHDGGAYMSLEAAQRQLAALIAAGADLIDIGGMSSRPGHTPLDAQEEISRVLPLLQAAARDCPLPLSIDTDKAEVAAAAITAGARIINYSGGELDAAVFRLAAEKQAPLVMMHRAGQAGAHADICGEVEQFFRAAIAFARAQGVDEQWLILDPGLGFAKDERENLQLMRAIPRFSSLGRPLLYGFSHKRFVAALSGERPGQAPLGNLAAAAYAARQGAHILRMHEVADCRAFLTALTRLATGSTGRDKILLPRIAAEGRHGCNAEEKLRPQPFTVEIGMAFDTAAAAAGDDLRRTIDYGAVYIKVKKLVEESSFNLIETLAERIARLVLAETPAAMVTVRVEKCAARAGEESFPAAVAIERTRL